MNALFRKVLTVDPALPVELGLFRVLAVVAQLYAKIDKTPKACAVLVGFGSVKGAKGQGYIIFFSKHLLTIKA